jgi:hypothetical protein
MNSDLELIKGYAKDYLLFFILFILDNICNIYFLIQYQYYILVHNKRVNTVSINIGNWNHSSVIYSDCFVIKKRKYMKLRWIAE